MVDFLLSGIVVMILFYIVKRNSEKESVKQQNEDTFIVRLPKLYTWIGAICATFFLVIFIWMLIYPDGTANFWVGTCFLGFVIVGGIMTNASLAWRIHVHAKHDFFRYRTFFWRTLQIPYAEIQHVRTSRTGIILTVQKKKRFIDQTAYNADVFHSIIQQRAHMAGNE